MHSKTRPPSQHAMPATCTRSAGIASPVWMPVEAWPAMPGVIAMPAPTTRAASFHHQRSGCSAAGRRCSSTRSSGMASTRSASRISAMWPYRVSSSSRSTVVSNTSLSGRPAP